jgi:hypothetical protein
MRRSEVQIGVTEAKRTVGDPSCSRRPSRFYVRSSRFGAFRQQKGTVYPTRPPFFRSTCFFHSFGVAGAGLVVGLALRKIAAPSPFSPTI